MSPDWPAQAQLAVDVGPGAAIAETQIRPRQPAVPTPVEPHPPTDGHRIDAIIARQQQPIQPEQPKGRTSAGRSDLVNTVVTPNDTVVVQRGIDRPLDKLGER